MFFSYLYEEDFDKIHIDYGIGKISKILNAASIDTIRELKTALIGLHVFTGNDYISSFFRKSKK